MSINCVTISGNLTRDAELRSTQSGVKVLKFAVAVNDYRRGQHEGEWVEYPNFVECAMFGNRAEAVSKFLRKGIKVSVKGRLRWSQWERDGQKRSKLEVVAEELEFMSPRRDAAPGPVPADAAPTLLDADSGAVLGSTSTPGSTTTVYGQPPAATVYDEEIPF